jgi:hypothetical protein
LEKPSAPPTLSYRPKNYDSLSTPCGFHRKIAGCYIFARKRYDGGLILLQVAPYQSKKITCLKCLTNPSLIFPAGTWVLPRQGNGSTTLPSFSAGNNDNN